MKNLVILLLSGWALIPARAQWLHPEAVQGAFLGGLIGGIADSHQHAFSGRNAALGAGVGLMAGSLLGAANRSRSGHETTFHGATSASLDFGSGYSSSGGWASVGYTSDWQGAPRADYPSTRPHYAASGVVLGAAAGALIGTAHHQAGTGALLGAAAGLVVGGVAETAATRRERLKAPDTNPPANPPPAAGSRPHRARQQPAAPPGRSSTSASAPRPQIADAPRVPDAPTF